MPTAADARFWDKLARKYAAGPIADMAGYERTVERTRALIKPADAVLEFGCGTGTTALKLAGAAARYVATDISSEMIAICREKAAAEGRTDIAFEVATLDAPPWPDASFDVALGFNILHLIEARETALRNLHRLLKPGGLFISKAPYLTEMGVMLRVMVPAMQVFGRAPYVAFLSARDLDRDLAAAGFEIVERARHGSGKKDMREFVVARRV